MIHEFALEPALVATWADRIRGRYFIEQFGIGQPRVVSRFPKHWKRLVWDAFSSDNDLDRARLEAIVRRLTEVMIERKGFRWNNDSPWLANALVEHARFNFHAILTLANPDGLDFVLEADAIDHQATRWAVTRGAAVKRSAKQMALALAPMLRGAHFIVFIDPYFQPQEARFRNPFREFLLASIVGRAGVPLKSVHLLCAADGMEMSADYFRAVCERQLPRTVPHGLTISVARLRERDRSEKLHNRYVITDLGAVAFQIGLDEGDEGESDDVQLLERALYELRYQQYVSDTPAFDLPEGTFDVVGTVR
jgi:hypothetical protein